jgi:glycosyltransferase involved in cell wall biosynthesis
MNILILTNLYPPHHIGGYELICETVVTALRHRGHYVPILCSDHQSAAGGQKKDDPMIERVLQINGLYGHPWRGIRQLRWLEKHNNQVLCSALRRHQPDLVYVWNMGGLSKSMLHTLQAVNIPTVYYLSDHWIARGLGSDVWLRWWNRPDAPLRQRLLRRACTWTGVRRRINCHAPTQTCQALRFDRIYFCSRALRELTAAAGYSVAHGAVIYCPINPRYFHGEPAPPRREVRRLLYVGRLAEDKGVMTAFRALDLLRLKLRPSLSVYGRGDADYTAELAKFTQKRQLDVTFSVGETDQMPQVYRDHDLLLFTSEWPEPFALTPIEAMACGLPVVGTTTGGSAELFRNRENALVYAAGRADELAERIVEFSTDYSLRSHCARVAYCEAVQRYSAPVIVDQIESFLRETLRQRRKSF